MFVKRFINNSLLVKSFCSIKNTNKFREEEFIERNFGWKIKLIHSEKELSKFRISFLKEKEEKILTFSKNESLKSEKDEDDKIIPKIILTGFFISATASIIILLIQ